MRHVGGHLRVNIEVILRSSEGQYSVKQVLNSVKLSKTGTKLSKTQSELSKTQSNGRANLKKRLNTVYNQSWDPKLGCVLLPLGSPTRVPNTLYSTCGGCGSSVAGTGWVQGGWDRVGIQGG